MYGIILAAVVSLHVGDFATAKSLAINADYEASLSELKSFYPIAENINEYAFLMAVNYFAINDKEQALKWIYKAKDSFQILPLRHSCLLEIMQRDIEGWKNDDLGDIERDMKNVTNRLKSNYIGPKTQKIQTEIIGKLDKLIKEQEDAKNKQGMQVTNKSTPANQSTSPMDESNITENKGEGKVDEKKIKALAESWGKMPPAERAAATQDIVKDLPAKYRFVIEEYFKALNNRDN